MLKRLLPGLVCVAMLSACATTEKNTGAAKPAPSMAAAMTEADTALKEGHGDKAMTILHGAASAFPTDKAPWLRMAQMRYDSNNYGEAIVNALEALERDGDDMLAHSIVAVSGLRVASKALADLTQKNNLAGSIKSEAQELAKLLRASLGEEVLVPGTRNKGGRTPSGPKQTPVARNTQTPVKPASNDPFADLK
jgi:predicted Zn-dependent protease